MHVDGIYVLCNVLLTDENESWLNPREGRNTEQQAKVHAYLASIGY